MRLRPCQLAKSCAAIVAGLALCGACPEAHAGGPLGEQGARIETSNYGIDLFQGPVLATTRITALGGAFTAIAEGPDGITFNPAAVSLRMPYSTTRDDYDLTAGITLPASVAGTDFDNNGQVGFTYENFFWVTAGALVQHKSFGLGVIASFQNYELGVPGEVPLPNSNELIAAVIVRLIRIDPIVSYGYLRNQLHLALGPRFAGFYGVGRTGAAGASADNERLLLNSNTLGAQAGALWAPEALPLRIGAAVRSPSGRINSEPGRIASNAEGDRVVGSIYLPNRLDLPWEVEAGVAVQFWKRRLNIPWKNEEDVPFAKSEAWRRTIDGRKELSSRGARRLLKARYEQIPRERLLVSASALVSGPVKNAVGLESMLSQTIDRSGENVVVTLRAGVEAEILPYWLVLRAGSYLEPTRFRGGETRLHGTGGFAVRVLRSSVFGLFDDGTVIRVSAAIDAARDYLGWGFGAGVFY